MAEGGNEFGYNDPYLDDAIDNDDDDDDERQYLLQNEPNSTTHFAPNRACTPYQVPKAAWAAYQTLPKQEIEMKKMGGGGGGG